MRQLHIVQGGIENGDKALLEQVAASPRRIPSWIGPKGAAVDDDVVIYIGGYGFFATARVESEPRSARDWRNRYSFTIRGIRLIQPAISLGSIRRHVPGLTWAEYPRSITTPSAAIAIQIAELIRERRRTGLPDLDEEAIEGANLDELRRIARLKARSTAPTRIVQAVTRARVHAIRRYVLKRADGVCEGCQDEAPFVTPTGDPYLEPHHTTRLADEGPDDPRYVIALCPNCHGRVHHGRDGAAYNRALRAKLNRKETRNLKGP